MNISNYSDINTEDVSLRPYQQKAKRDIFESWDEVDNVMFQMPTGTGKTRLFTSIISDINKYSIRKKEAVKILIIAHRTELIDQIDESLNKYKVAHNVIAGGREKNYKYPVSVASIQTITNPRNLKEAKRLNVQFVIIDEAHHALAASYKKLWDMYPNAKRLGVTATPWRMNHQSFLDLFDKLVLSMTIKDFIDKGFLAPYKYYSLRSDSDIQKTIDDIELDRFGEYKESSMEEKMDIGSIRAQLLDSYLSLAEGKKGIIYAINIVHAKHICEEYKRAGYKAVSIDSKTPAAERKDLVDKFKRGLIDIIVNVDIFSEGFDCPDIEFIQLARPTRSLVKYLQQVGRGLRITENKENCVILDNVGMYSRFGLPDARRHWNYHFKGKHIDEEPPRIVSKGTGRHRDVDLTEGTEDMELIQDLNSGVGETENSAEVVDNNFDTFDAATLLQKYHYNDDNFVFSSDDQHIYEAYIHDDTYFVISELMIDERKHCVHRKRVGKIPMNSWMFWQMERQKVDHLKSITHYGANYTVFHYRVMDKDNQQKDKYFDYKGREIELPSVVEDKYERAKQEQALNDYIDVPVSKAIFADKMVRHKKHSEFVITRTLKGESRPIAIFPSIVDFLKMTYTKHTIYRSDDDSFMVRFTEEGKTYLYKYDFKGKLMKKGTVAVATADTSVKSEELSEDEIKKLWHVFDSKATSYKYFWFLSIMQIYTKKRQENISYKEILARMIINAWDYVLKNKAEFRKIDQLPVSVENVRKWLSLKPSANKQYVESKMKDYFEKSDLYNSLSPLLKNVPYRFLSPWIPFTDNNDVIEKSKNPATKCIYGLYDDHITINPLWRNYLIENSQTINYFIQAALSAFLKC